MNHFRIIFAWILLLCLTARAQDSVVPHVPTADEIAAQIGDGTTIIYTNGELTAVGGGATVIADGTNGVPVTNAASVILIEAPTNAVVVHTVNGSTSRVAISATSDIPGPQGATGAGNLQFYGNWVTNTPYGTNIIAVYGGQAYYTTRGVTSPTPPSADTTNWAIFAQAGSDGSNGTSGTNGLDGVGLVYRGTWSGGNLTTNDIVSYLGTSYVPLRDLTPSDQPDISTNYVVFVARGTDGASGSVVSNLFFLGDWVISTVYPSNSVVGYGGRVYYANKTASNYVTLAPSINSDFTLLIDEGADGTDGDDGLNGVSLVYDNCYDASKVYVSNVVVTYPCTGKKNLYRATGAGGPVVGVTPPSDASKWEEIISSGADADVQTFAFYSSYTTNIVYSNAWVKYVNGTVYYSLSTVPAGAGPLDTNYWAVVVTNGANGAAGASGTNGMNGLNGSAGPTNMQFMGSWVGGTFTTNQLVTWSGVTYFVNTASTTSRPPSSGWDIFVDRGPEGPVGTNYTTYYTNVITYVYLTNQIVTNISYVTNTFNYTNVSYTSIITVVTNTYTATNVYASVEAYSDSVNGLRTSPSNSSVLQFCLTNGTSSGGISGPYVSPNSNNTYAAGTTQRFNGRIILDPATNAILTVQTGTTNLVDRQDRIGVDFQVAKPGAEWDSTLSYPRGSYALGSTIAGGSQNYIAPSAEFSTILNGARNFILSSRGYSIGGMDFSVLGTGSVDSICIATASTNNDVYSVLIGGSQSKILGTGPDSDIGGHNGIFGGWQNAIGYDEAPNNNIPAVYCTIGGGALNTIGGGNGASPGAHVIGGGYDNHIYYPGRGNVISGGEDNRMRYYGANLNDFSHNVIAGGLGNSYNGTTTSSRVISGGVGNSNIYSYAGTIAGGSSNVLVDQANFSAISGGWLNEISNAQVAVISGGRANRIAAGGHYAAIPGGYLNKAAGTFSQAGGIQANAAHNSSYVWSDNQSAGEFASTATNQFLIRASGGVGIGTNAPTQALDVNGNVKVSGSLTNGFFFPLGDYLRSNGTNLFFVNSTGGVAQITSM